MREVKFRYIIELPADFIHKGDPVKTTVEYHTLEEIERGLTGFVNHRLVRVLSRNQFTSQKDKLNNEIYDGDIIRTFDLNPYSKKPGIIYWDNGSARWYIRHTDGLEFDNGDYYNGDEINDWSAFESVGNITQNPDLLK